MEWIRKLFMFDTLPLWNVRGTRDVLTDTKPAGCLDDATIASFIDRMGLSLTERNRAVAHFAECRRCRTVLAGAAHLH